MAKLSRSDRKQIEAILARYKTNDRTMMSAQDSIPFLPPYSPDLNPIERLWAKMKAILRREKIRAADELSDAVARTFSHISVDDCSVWFHLVDLVR